MTPTWRRSRRTRALSSAPGSDAIGHRPLTSRLVVGRFLQVLGAEELRYEVPGTEGASVDWVAVFADGAVSVEATAPAVNAVIGAAVTAAGPIMDLLVEIAPPGWHPMVVRGPS